MAHRLVGNEEIYGLGLHSPGPQPVGPLSALQPIGFGHRELVQAGQMLVHAAELFAGPDSLEKLEQDG